MLLRIEDKVLEKYPEMEIGYVVAQVSVIKKDPFVESLKLCLLKALEEKGINATNFAAHPSISIWREIYENDFLVKPKTYRSSIEALLKRVVTGKEIWNICNVVDLYNCCSVFSLLPMGGYDLDKISGDIVVRYAKEGELFQGLGEREKVEVKANHIIYGDDKRVLCWLWNHKDSAETGIDENSKNLVFFIDSARRAEAERIPQALQLLTDNLEKIQGVTFRKGVLNKLTPEIRFLPYTHEDLIM